MADGPVDIDEYDLCLAKGIDCLNTARNFEGGLAAFSRAIEIHPERAAAWALKAFLLFSGGRSEAAVEVFDVALKIDPKHPAVQLFAGAWIAHKQKQLVEGLDLIEMSLEGDPSSAVAWREKAIILSNLNWLQESVEAADKAIDLGDNSGFSHSIKGSVLVDMNRYEEAVKALDAAIRRDPECYSWWQYKGIALAKLKRHEEAVAMYDKALGKCSTDYHVYYNKGISLMKMGRYAEALRLYEKAIEMNPDYAMAWNNKSLVLQWLGWPEDSRKAKARAVEIDPDMVSTEYCNAKQAMENGNKAIALDCLRRAVKKNPEIEKKIKEEPLFKDLWEH